MVSIRVALDRNRTIPAVLLGIVAVVVTLLRLWLGDPRSLTEVLWAEDGYFPACVRGGGGAECLARSFAGYYLLIPRVVAAFVASWPLEYWPIISVVLAAFLTGLSASIVFLSLRAGGLCSRASVLGALALPLSPLFGLEVAGVVASSYVPFLVAASAIVVFVSPVRGTSRAVTSAFLLAIALTMPSVAVLLLIPLLRVAARDLGRRVAIEWMTALGIGLLLQALVAVSAPEGRGLSISRASLRTWLDGVTDSVLSVVPGLSWSQADFTPLFPLTAPWYGPWLLVGVAVTLSSAAIVSSWRGPVQRSLRASLLTLTGAGLSLFPSLAGTFSYRYFVAPVAIWLLAAVVMADPWIGNMRRRTFIACVVLVGLLWAPSFAASQVRSSPAPSWLEELDRAASACRTSGTDAVEVLFTPVWPGDYIGRDLDPPVVRCRDLA